MTHRFLQFHTLTSYPAALLNRDDAGFAKRIPFGGRTRTRVSSQCLKRHWRTFDGEHALAELDVPRSVRSRLTFEKQIVEPLVQAGLDEKAVRAATEAVMGEVLGESAKAKQKKAKQAEDGEEAGIATGQITVLGEPEVAFLRTLVQAIAETGATDAKKLKEVVKEKLDKDQKKNLRAVGAGLDAALFGRMVTSDILARSDAAIHVAHAFTVHDEESEADYFSAVDDLTRGGDDEALGSGHIGSTELTSGLFYGYVVVDVPLLVSNLTGAPREAWEAQDPALAGRVVEQLVHLIAKVSPGAKLGSTAPYSYASFMMIEAGDRQPRSLANAFLRPVRKVPDVLENAYQALAAHVSDMDRVYGNGFDRRLVGIGPVAGLADAVRAEQAASLDALAEWAAGRLGAAHG